MDRKAFIQRIATFVLLLALTISFYCIQCHIISLADRTLPYGVTLRSATGVGLTFTEIQNASVKIKDIDALRYQYAKRPATTENSLNLGRASKHKGNDVGLCGVSLKKAFITSELTADISGATLVLTDSSYNETIPMDIIRGNFFEVSPIPEENRFIVISDELAVKHFKSYDVIGKSLNIDQLNYTICGVYKSNHSLLTRLSSNGLENIYMPYSGVPDYDRLPVTLMIARSNSAFPQSIIDDIQQAGGIAIYPETISNYTATFALIKQSRLVTLFVCGLIFIATFLWVLIKQLNRTYKSYRAMNNRKNFIRNVVISAVYLIALIVLFCLVKFKLYLPSSMLPADNIFDFKFYADLIISVVQSRNDTMLYDFHWNFAIKAMAYSACASFFTFISFVITYTYAVKSVKWWRGNR